MTTQSIAPRAELPQEEYQELLLAIIFFLSGEEETSWPMSLG